MKQEENRSDIVIYKAEDDQTTLEVTLEDQTVWLSLNQMASLFLRDKSVISRHLRNVLKEKELLRDSTVAKFATVQKEKNRVVERQIEYRLGKELNSSILQIIER
jgi:hypothetical protein